MLRSNRLAALTFLSAMSLVRIAGADQTQEFRVTEVTLTPKSSTIRTTCPTTVDFAGSITANGPGTALYQLVKSTDASPTQPIYDLQFAEAGTKTITASFLVDRSMTAYQFVRVTSSAPPLDSSHEAGKFTVECVAAAPPPEPRREPPQPPQEPRPAPETVVEEFSVTPTQAAPGETVTATWTVKNSSRVELQMPGSRTRQQPLSGDEPFTIPDRATGKLEFKLNARSKEGETIKLSKFVQIVAPPPAQTAAAALTQGVNAWNTRRFGEARTAFEEAARLDPTLSDAHYWLAMVNMQEGKMPEAAKSLQEYLKLAPSGTYAKQASDTLAQIAKKPLVPFIAAVPINVAPSGKAIQSPTDWEGKPERAIDGNTNGDYAANSVSHTTDAPNSFWELTLPRLTQISTIVVFNRTDCCGDRLSNFRISVLDETGSVTWSRHIPDIVGDKLQREVNAPGKQVRIQLLGRNLSGNGVLSLAEVQVFGVER